MMLHIQFPPEIEAKLRERAEATGKSVDQVIREAVESELSGAEAPAPEALTREEQVRRWNAWAERMRQLGEKNIPPGHVVDDSRDSIYAGRGE